MMSRYHTRLVKVNFVEHFDKLPELKNGFHVIHGLRFLIIDDKNSTQTNIIFLITIIELHQRSGQDVLQQSFQGNNDLGFANLRPLGRRYSIQRRDEYVLVLSSVLYLLCHRSHHTILHHRGYSVYLRSRNALYLLQFTSTLVPILTPSRNRLLVVKDAVCFHRQGPVDESLRRESQ